MLSRWRLVLRRRIGRSRSRSNTAAGIAARRGAPEVAAALLEHAVRLTPIDSGDARRARTIAAAEQHWASANAARASGLLEALMPELCAGPIRARALEQLALIRNDDWRVAEALLEQAITEAGDDDRVRARAEARLAAILSNRGKFRAELSHARAAVAAAERCGDPGLLAQTLATQAVSAFFNGQGINSEQLQRAVALERSCAASAYALPSTALGQVLFFDDDLDAARPVLERMAALAGERGEEYDRVAIVYHLAILEWRAGNREAAERHHNAAEEMLGQGELSTDLWTIWGDSLFAAGRGQLDVARERAEEAVRVADRIGDAADRFVARDRAR